MKKFFLRAAPAAFAIAFAPFLVEAQHVTGGQTAAAGSTQDFSGATHTRPAIVVADAGSLPATCTVGEQAFVTAATAGQQGYKCSATNTWTQDSGSGGGGAAIPSVTNVIKGDGSGNGADTKVAITSPATAATLAFSADNETVTLPNGTVVANSRNVNTSSPLSGGGDLSADRTLACATCVAASSPGAGVAHFAGSTQTATSSAVVESDVTLADNTTDNVSTTKHGFAPKAPNDATKYLDGTGAYSVPVTANNKTRSIGASFDGAGSALTSGSTETNYFTVPFACTISAWDATVDTGTITFDVWKIASGTAIPTVSNTVTASALPAIASGTALHSTTLTGWTTSVAANDIFGINIEAVATATKASLVLECDQ